MNKGIIQYNTKMDTIFMNSRNSKTYNFHRLLLNLADKIDWRRKDKYIAFSIFYIWKNIKQFYKNNKFKISFPTWHEEFELPDGSYSISDILDYFEYILKKHGENTINPSIRVYINKIENRITFQIKTWIYLKLSTPKTIKLLGSTKSKTTKNENGKNVPNLEIIEVVLGLCNIVEKSYHRNSRVLYTFVHNKSFG